MTRYGEFKSNWALLAFPSGGPASSVILPAPNTTNGVGLTLAASTTYYFPFAGERYGSVVETTTHGLSAMWPSGITGTVTVEATCFPRTQTGTDQGPGDVNDWDATQAWQKYNPTQAGSVYANADGTSGSFSAFTLTIAAGAGGAYWNIPDFGALRMRAKIVTTLGGYIRFYAHAKLGS